MCLNGFSLKSPRDEDSPTSYTLATQQLCREEQMTSTGIHRIARTFVQVSVCWVLAHFIISAPLADAGLKGELKRGWKETWQQSGDVQADQSPRGANMGTSSRIKARQTDQRIENIRSVESDLAKELNARVAQIKADCRDGCKDFAVWCNAPDRIGKADRANGVSDARFVGLEWLQLGRSGFLGSDYEQKWRVAKLFMRFEKVNGVWSKKDEIGLGDETVPICDRSR